MAQVAPQRTPLVQFDDIPGTLPDGTVPDDVNLDKIAQHALFKLNNLQLHHLASNATWRDLLALTGTYRTFDSPSRVYPVFTKLSQQKKRSIFRLYEGHPPRVGRGGKDCSWVDIDILFSAQHDNLAESCRGTVSVTFNTEKSEWKIWMLRTWLECFDGLGHPDILKPVSELPNGTVNGGTDAVDGLSLEDEYDALIIGGGQAGLSAAGRLKALGLKYLLIEQHSELGDVWRKRYESLRWHTSKEYGSLPFDHTYQSEAEYMVPTYRIGEGQQAWAERYGITAKTNTTGKSARYDKSTRQWTVETSSPDGNVTLRAKNLILAIGPGLAVPVYPPWGTPEKVKESGFNGTVLHSFDGYHSAHQWAGKKGIVIGTANTGHDVAEDMANANMTTTMVQRKPNTCEADRESFTYPNKIMRDMTNRNVWAGVAANPARFDALEAAGFKVDRYGDVYTNIFIRLGGHYVDIGCSARIAKGEIAVKTQTVEKLTEQGLKFEDGSVVEADLVVLCTGFDRVFRNAAAKILGEEVAEQMDDFWGTDAEGELRALAKPAGYPNLYYHGGDVRNARWFSRFLALQIQADVLGKPLEPFAG